MVVGNRPLSAHLSALTTVVNVAMFDCSVALQSSHLSDYRVDEANRANSATETCANNYKFGQQFILVNVSLTIRYVGHNLYYVL